MAASGDGAMDKKLDTVEEVKKAFSDKQVDRWIMVGYRQWWKRKYGKSKSNSRYAKANKALKSMTNEEIAKLVDRIKEDF